MRRKLESDDATALGILTRIWLWALKNADEKSGRVLDADEEDIQNVLRTFTKVPPEKAVDALFSAGWLDRKGDDIYVHDWNEWQEYWYKAKVRREKDALRKKKGGSSTSAKDAVTENCDEEDYEDEEELSEHSESDSSSQPHRKKEYSKEFEEIWAMYPRRVNKSAAYAKYNARLNEGWSSEQLKEATAAYAAQIKRNGTEEKYIKHPQTFFGPNNPFIDFLKNKGSLVEETPDAQRISNPFSEYRD